MTKSAIIDQRSRVMSAIRRYFMKNGFTEVVTPALQVSPGLEPHLKAFKTTLQSPSRSTRDVYLHTSPEFAMKKLLSAGMQKIFQIAQVFRNQERSHTHHPEFAMLEWYRRDADYTVLMNDCEELLRTCAVAVGEGGYFTWNQQRSDPFRQFECLSVQDAFLRYAETDLLSTIEDPKNPDSGILRGQCHRLGISTASDDTWEDLFFRIFLTRIEPHLGVGVPTILCDYPVSMAALSRPKPGAPHLSERFELYVCGLELANAFGELTDVREQRRRFEVDMVKKQKLYGETYPIDEEFMDALSRMPASSGIALGVDRLVMLATGASHIEETLAVPVVSLDH